MTSELSNPGFAIADLAPTDPRLLADPLEFIKVDHIHMRAMCLAMEQQAASDKPDSKIAAAVTGFLERELALLIDDEDTDLHDLLIARCQPEDEIDETLARVEAEHKALSGMISDVMAAFRAIHAAGRRADADEARMIRDFSSLLRRHVMVENAIVLPFARIRLTRSDLNKLAASMVRRRGGAESG